MKFKKFMQGLFEIETLANELMANVAMQVTQDASGEHSAIVIVRTPYDRRKQRELKIVVSPYAPDELLIELDPADDTHFKADAAGFYKYLWLAAESDLANAKGGDGL